jgi:arylsulfatase A
MRKIIALIVILFALRPALAAQRGPNILMIYADDLGWGDVSFNGRTQWETPNLDQLAREGTCFKRWYTAAAVCAPSRAALMTGRYSIHNGVTGNFSLDLPSDEVTIAEALKMHGYATALFGKWHHGYRRPGMTTYTHPMDQGFDTFFGYTDAVDAWQKFPKKLWDGRSEKPVQGYADTLFADQAVDFISRRKPADEPFFIYLAFVAPHGVQEAPEDEIQAHLHDFTDAPLASARLQATYAAQVTQMDKEIARVLKALADAKLDANTLVVFSSDHGSGYELFQKGTSVVLDSNKPFRGQKRTLWEGGVRVPAIVRWPGHVPAGKTSQEIIHMIDLFPTFLAAAGTAPDPAWKIDGVNVLEALEGKAPAPQRTIFWEWDEGGNRQLAALQDNLKLVINADNKAELYDVVIDPAERIDRSDLYRKQTRAMVAATRAWYATMSPAAKLKRPTTPATQPASRAGHSPWTNDRRLAINQRRGFFPRMAGG